MCAAVAQGETDIVNLLLEDSRFHVTHTLLYNNLQTAVRYGFLEVAHILLSHPQLNLTEREKLLLVQTACKERSKPLLKLLLSLNFVDCEAQLPPTDVSFVKETEAELRNVKSARTNL